MSTYGTNNDMLVEAVNMTDGDILVGYSARNRRSRAWKASALAEYMKARISPAAVSLNTTSNVVTITLGDGTTVVSTTST